MKALNNFETIVFGGGCFWCLEAVFNRVKGIISVVSGYAGGALKNPTYDQVSSGKTGHVEVVKIDFDKNMISLEEILQIFFTVHDPTTLNRQGNDVGTQYRSIILFSSNEQKEIAQKTIKEIENEKVYANKIVTELMPLEKFYPAEEYHQKYFEKNSNAAYCQIAINPKIAKLRKEYSKFYLNKNKL